MTAFGTTLRWTGYVLLGLSIAAAAILGTMRLGWWNPAYSNVVAKYATPPSKFVMVGDVKLHVRDEGRGPVILMLHSSMSNLREWDGWADRLKTRYRVIRIDWPPYGLSTDPNPSTGMSGVVALLERFVDQKQLARFALVGNSSGATISVLYAAAHPERVTALALSTLPLAAPPPTKFSPAMAAMIWLHDTIVPNYYPRFYYRMALGSFYGVAGRLQPETVDWYHATNNIPGGFARVRQYYAANKQAVWSKGAAREAAMVTAPILLQWGDADPVLPPHLAAAAVAQFSRTQVTLVRYPDIGHYPVLENAGETSRAVLAFFDRVLVNPKSQ